MVLSAPSVFNFYSPFYRPQGGQGQISPEMQIITEDSVVGFINLMAQVLYTDRPMHNHSELSEMRLDLSDLNLLVSDTQTFLLQIERLFFAGTMSAHTHEVLATALEDAAGLSAQEQVKLVLYLALISPDQATSERNVLR
jgi:hypothetical protein